MPGDRENGHIAFNEPHEADFNDPKLVKKISLDENAEINSITILVLHLWMMSRGMLLP